MHRNGVYLFSFIDAPNCKGFEGQLSYQPSYSSGDFWHRGAVEGNEHLTSMQRNMRACHSTPKILPLIKRRVP